LDCSAIEEEECVTVIVDSDLGKCRSCRKMPNLTVFPCSVIALAKHTDGRTDSVSSRSSEKSGSFHFLLTFVSELHIVWIF
jgi:hypothetical protein